MPAASKTKQFLLAAAKLSIVAAALWFIWLRLSSGDMGQFRNIVQRGIPIPVWAALVVLAIVNRGLEIFKWQNLVKTFTAISLQESFRQVMGAMTAAVFTPAGVGEYGVKALYYDGKSARRVVFLNLLCNGAQMAITVVFGLAGLAYLNLEFHLLGAKFVLFGLVALGFILSILYIGRRFSVKGYSFENAISKLGGIPRNIHRKNLLLAFLRYAAFSHQYFLILWALGIPLDYPTTMALVCSVYFLSSSLPTFQFLDFAVKGGVAVFFFGLFGIDGWLPLFAATLIWLLNVVAPVLIGSYFVLTFKPAWNR
jgi:hypothetical protein